MDSGIKQQTYDKEEKFLSPYACKSKDSKGRKREEEPCPMRTDFQRDRDRIIYCNAFKRLRNKTQVFIDPKGDHYTTRLTHTLTVSQVARSIARSLSLNEDLAEAIALGHDLGHTPFGHAGERVLGGLNGFGFEHNEQSGRVVEVLERDGNGLNLTVEVINGIVGHKKGMDPGTLEGTCVSLADRIAYINQDIEDAERGGVLKKEDLPRDAVKVLGATSKERINTALASIYETSKGQPFVKMAPEVEKASDEMRQFMYENVYFSQSAKDQEKRVEYMLKFMYDYYMGHIETLPELYQKLMERGDTPERAVTDYISSMTDRFALSEFDRLFTPRSWAFLDDGR